MIWQENPYAADRRAELRKWLATLRGPAKDPKPDAAKHLVDMTEILNAVHLNTQQGLRQFWQYQEPQWFWAIGNAIGLERMK